MQALVLRPRGGKPLPCAGFGTVQTWMQGMEVEMKHVLQKIREMHYTRPKDPYITRAREELRKDIALRTFIRACGEQGKIEGWGRRWR